MNKFTAVLCASLVATTVNAQQSNEEQFIESRSAQVDVQVSQSQERLNVLRKELASKKKQLSGLRSQIASVEQDIAKTSNDLSKSSIALSSASKRLDAINGDLANTKKQNQVAQLSIAEASSQNQQLQERMVEQQIARDSGLQDLASSRASTPELSSAAAVQMNEGLPAAPESNSQLVNDPVSVAVQSADQAAQDRVSDAAVLKPIESAPLPTESDVVLAQNSEEADVAVDEQDQEDGVIVESAKAGGEFVKEETKSVVKSAAKSAVRSGIRGALGL